MNLEGWIERIALESDEALVATARADFTRRTGELAPDEPWYEERVRAAFEDAVTHYGAPRALILRRWLERNPSAPAIVAALLRSWRTILSVRSVGAVVSAVAVLTGAELEIVPDEGPSGRLRDGDLFIGRVLAHEGVRLMPGVLFFERDAHAAITSIVSEAAKSGRSSDETCDALLRMQMRLFRQSSLRPHHVYRWDAFDRTEILAAPWAKKRA